MVKGTHFAWDTQNNKVVLLYNDGKNEVRSEISLTVAKRLRTELKMAIDKVEEAKK